MFFNSLPRCLRSHAEGNQSGRVRRGEKRLRVAPTRLSLEQLEDRTVPSTFTVLNLNDSGAGSLRQAVLDANATAGADLINFAPGLKGTIALTNGELNVTDDLTIDGSGAAKLTISGNNASRVFNISGAATDVVIDGLTIADGLAAGHTALGGGILNTGGHVTISQVIFTTNQARGEQSPAATAAAGGGAIANVFGATLTVTASTFSGNKSFGLSRSDGGAILNDAGSTLTVDGSAFSDNRTFGFFDPDHPGFYGAEGGALANLGQSTALISHTTFTDNQARGGQGEPGQSGGTANGGAVYNGVSLLVHGSSAFGAILTVSHCTFHGNEARSGAGGNAVGAGPGAAGGFVAGGAIVNDTEATATVTDTVFDGNWAVGGAGGESFTMAAGGRGGYTVGGAIAAFNSRLTVERSVFTENRAVGGAGGDSLAAGGGGFLGRGGAIFAYGAGTTSQSNSPAVVDLLEVVMLRNQATGGVGGAGGTGQGGGGGRARGGALSTEAVTVNVWHSAFDGNRATGGAGGAGATAGAGGDGHGGAIANGPAQLAAFGTVDGGHPSLMTVSDSVLVNNQATGGAGRVGGHGLGGALNNGLNATVTIANTSICNNQAIGGAGTLVGGNGLGGGIFNQNHSTVTLLDSTVTKNQANGGAGSTPGQGVGGGIYNAAGGTVCVDLLTLIAANDASISDDDVVGDLC